MAAVVNVNDLLDSHVVLDLECLDRIYLNAYVPNLQVGGQVAMFMTRHLGLKIASPAIMEKIGLRFRRDVEQFAKANQIPMVRFAKGDRQIDVMRPYLDAATGPGVVAIGCAQEFQWVFTGTRGQSLSGVPFFKFDRAERRVSVFYFYVVDAEFGAGFIKICTYFPYPAKVWINSHDWAKRQATKAGIAYLGLEQVRSAGYTRVPSRVRHRPSGPRVVLATSTCQCSCGSPARLVWWRNAAAT